MIEHLVIGGGISGLLTAYYLNQAGKNPLMNLISKILKQLRWIYAFALYFNPNPI